MGQRTILGHEFGVPLGAHHTGHLLGGGRCASLGQTSVPRLGGRGTVAPETRGRLVVVDVDAG
jgi:hypothetical protein